MLFRSRAGIDRSERVQALKRLVKFGEARVRMRLAAGQDAAADTSEKP